MSWFGSRCCLAAATLAALAGCGSEPDPRATAVETARPTTSVSAPSPTPQPTREPTPEPSPQACGPVDDAALAERLRATLQPPYDDPLFQVSGVVSLPTTYQGDSWTYYAGKIGPSIDGQQSVGVWADQGGQIIGVKFETEEGDDDGHFDFGVDHEAAFSPAAETGPLHWNNDRTRVALCALGQDGGVEPISTEMTLAQYEQLRTGSTTLAQLTALVGEQACSEDSESTVGGIRTVGLTCRGRGEAGANAILIFQNGVLVSKSQAGLSN
jgi:hypothetical protein